MTGEIQALPLCSKQAFSTPCYGFRHHARKFYKNVEKPRKARSVASYFGRDSSNMRQLCPKYGSAKELLKFCQRVVNEVLPEATSRYLASQGPAFIGFTMCDGTSQIWLIYGKNHERKVGETWGHLCYSSCSIEQKDSDGGPTDANPVGRPSPE